MQLEFLSDDNLVPVNVARDGEDWRLILDGQDVPLQASPDGEGAWLVETHQGRRRIWVAERGDERLVFCDGKVHTFRLVDPDHDDEAEDSAAGPNLVADMPGKVVKVSVEMGQQVVEGQTVLIMESMKMETELTAAQPGTVMGIHVGEGQVVGQGDALLDIDPDGEN